MDKDIYEILNDTLAEEYETLELTESEKMKMKRNFNKSFKKGHKKYYALAACVAAVAVVSQTAFAQTLVSNIIKSVSTGHNVFSVIEYPTSAELPEEYKGLFFDKDGNKIDEFRKGEAVYNFEGEMLINENGEMIAEYVDKDGYELVREDGASIKVSVAKEDDPIAEGTNDKCYVVTDESLVGEKLNFTPAMASYLPEGYKFYGATLYKGNKGEISGDYLAVYYKNEQTGKQFSLHERIINDETAFESGTSGEIKEISIKGHKAVVMDKSSVNWEENGISVSLIAGESGISEDELIKIAESAARE